METAEQLEEMIGMIEEMMGTCISIASFASAAYFHYQFNMIARRRLDHDTAELRWDSTFERCSICAAYAINTQLCWSKNVCSEEDAPPQEILMGAAEATRFCALMGLDWPYGWKCPLPKEICIVHLFLKLVI